MLKKVLALHDMVCLGRCSLTVVLPVLSAMGIKVCPLPTALLSSDTGGFGAVYVRSLTDEMRGILQKLEALDVSFDAVYSGYLGSPEQVAVVERILGRFDSLRIVDPVMGDMGKLYQNIDGNMIEAMRRLCANADVITPNLTEACFLAGWDMPPEGLDASSAGALADALLELGCGAAVITSVPLQGQEGRIATMVKEKGGKLFAASTDHLRAHFPGTGDLFASVLTGRMLAGETLAQACAQASAFAAEAIGYTVSRNTPVREGVLLEELLGRLQPGVSGACAELLEM